MMIRKFVCLPALLLLAVLSTIAVADSPIAGAYEAEGKTADGQAYGGQVRIEPHGEGVRLAWALDQGDGYRGLGLQVDDVLGSVYWLDREQFGDPGIVVYRIDGGTMRGVWMPYSGPKDRVGREDLVGPASLEGRFEITLGLNPDGRSNYTGHVDVDRRGNTYHFHWYAPTDSYIGSGIRIGNVMVVGYALRRAPGTVAYCVRGGDLDGIWTYGESARLGRETLRRKSDAADSGPSGQTGTECLPTVASTWQRASNL